MDRFATPILVRHARVQVLLVLIAWNAYVRGAVAFCRDVILLVSTSAYGTFCRKERPRGCRVDCSYIPDTVFTLLDIGKGTEYR